MKIEEMNLLLLEIIKPFCISVTDFSHETRNLLSKSNTSLIVFLSLLKRKKE